MKSYVCPKNVIVISFQNILDYKQKKEQNHWYVYFTENSLDFSKHVTKLHSGFFIGFM